MLIEQDIFISMNLIVDKKIGELIKYQVYNLRIGNVGNDI